MVWMKLDISGGVWMCLGGSRLFGCRLRLAGQSWRHQIDIAHDGSGVGVVGVREQLGGSGRLCVEEWSDGSWHSLQFPLVEGWPATHGLG